MLHLRKVKEQTGMKEIQFRAPWWGKSGTKVIIWKLKSTVETTLMNPSHKHPVVLKLTKIGEWQWLQPLLYLKKAQVCSYQIENHLWKDLIPLKWGDKILNAQTGQVREVAVVQRIESTSIILMKAKVISAVKLAWSNTVQTRKRASMSPNLIDHLQSYQVKEAV